ncbi:MAG: hypothetical protein ACXIUL_12300 [Wenzhouxiangella sp.]
MSFDTEWVTTPEHDPASAIAKLAEVAGQHNQMDVFVSKVLRNEDDSSNARPGLELYFQTPKDLEASKPIIEQIVGQGLDGFSFIVDPRARVAGREGGYIGVRSRRGVYWHKDAVHP